MLNSSKKYCLITQFTKTENNLKNIVEKELNIKKAYDPHNDRETVEAIFNILWAEGYEPEISYIREKKEYKFSYEEVIKTYDDIYGKLAKEKDIDLSEIIKRFTIDNIVNIEEDISLALIFLDKSIKNN